MKRLLITLVALALGMTAFAQYGPGHHGSYGPGYGSSYRPSYGPRFGYLGDGDFEFGLTLNHFTTGEKDGYKAFRPDRIGFFGEYRVDLSPVMDIGLQLSTTFGKGSLESAADPYGPDMWYWQGAPLVVTDINRLPYTGFNPYIGLGVGPGFGYEKNIFDNTHSWTQALVISPRAGLELFEHLRLSVQYQWYLNGAFTYSHVSFGFSWAFQPMGYGRGAGYRR